MAEFAASSRDLREEETHVNRHGSNRKFPRAARRE